MKKIKIFIFSRHSLLGLVAFITLLVFLMTAVLPSLSETAQRALETVTGVKKLLPIYSVGTKEPKIAISFDATWGAQYTEEILRILQERKIKTTFFLVNIWLEKYPDVAKKIAQEGHEIGMHSTTHPHFNRLTEGQIKEELQKNYQMIKDVTGYTPVLFRPPFGEYSNKVIRIADELGFKTIQWDVDSLDWKDIGSGAIAKRVLKQVKPGSIVLFHNNAKDTPPALPIVLDQLLQQGYQIVPISDLLLKGDYYIDHEGIQRPGKPGNQ